MRAAGWGQRQPRLALHSPSTWLPPLGPTLPPRYDKVVDIPNSMTVLPELLPMSIEMAKVRG